MTVLDAVLLAFVISLYAGMLVSDARWRHTYGKIGRP
jgi:hypothetical protein